MNLELKNNAIEKYFGFLNRLNKKTKKRLIVKLKKSIEVEENKEYDLKSLYGAWEDSRSSDEIILDIRDSRVEKTKSIELL